MTQSEAILSDPKDAPIYEAQKSLKRIQNFNPETLVQSARLGEYNFDKAVSPAQKIIALFKEAPADSIYTLPKNQLSTLQSEADVAYSYFDEILRFSVNEGDVESRITGLVTRLDTAYQSFFDQISPITSYLITRTIDFHSLGEQGRAALQAIKDQSDV